MFTAHPMAAMIENTPLDSNFKSFKLRDDPLRSQAEDDILGSEQKEGAAVEKRLFPD